MAPLLPTDMKPIGATATLGGLDLATSYVELLANGLATIEDDLAVVRHNDRRIGRALGLLRHALLHRLLRRRLRSTAIVAPSVRLR